MFEATQDGLGRNAPVHSIHGSLLAVGELLRLVEIVDFSFFFLISNNFIKKKNHPFTQIV